MSQVQFKQDDFQPSSANHNEGASFDDAPRKTMPKIVKYLAGTAVGLAILAGAGGFIATQILDQQKYKSMIVSKIEDTTGYKIDWDGNISLGLMPLPHASVKKLTVASGETEILSIAKADIQVALAPLLSRKIDIKSITLDEPVVTLKTTKSGQKTWVASAKKQTEQKNDQVGSDNTEQTSSPLDLNVARIDINGGSFLIDNQQSGSQQELKNLNVTLRAESLKGPFDIKGDTEWSGQKIEIKATSGEVNVAEGNYPIQAEMNIPSSGINFSFAGIIDGKNMGANGDINLDVSDIANAVKGMTGTAPDLPEGLVGKAMVAGKIAYTANRVAIDDLSLSVGDVSYAGQIVAEGLTENATPQLSFKLDPKSRSNDKAAPIVQLLSDLKIDAKGSVENDKIQIAYANLKTRGNDISINGFSSMGSNPTADLNVTASEINLDSLSKKLSASVPEKAGNSNAKNDLPKDLGFSIPFSGRLRADITKLTTGAKTYSNIKADVVSSGGALTISNAEVMLPENTSININGKIGDTKSLSGLNLKVIAKTSDTERLVSAYNIKLPELPKKIGMASMNGNFTGDLKDLGFSATVSALQFNVTGQGNVGDVMGTPDINSLKFTLRHPNFNEAMRTFQNGFDGSSGFFGPLDVSGQVAWGGDKVDVAALSGKLGQTSVSGNISAITQPKTKLSGALNFGNIVLPSATDSSGSVAAKSKPSSPQSSGGGDRWSRDAIETSWMHSFNADLDIKAKSITQNMWKLTDANFDFKLNDGVLTLNDVSAGLFGGRAALNGVIKSGAGAKDPLSISAKLNADSVNAQQLMSAATGKVSYTLTGILSKVDVAVNATGASSAALIQTLGGNGSINGKNIVVKGIDAGQLAAAAKGSYKPLERAGSLFQSFQSGQTEFSDFNSDFLIQNGVVNFSKINFDGPNAQLVSNGNVNLPKWTVDLKNTMTVKGTDIPPFDFTIRGQLDSPINSGGDIINNYLQKKFEKKATKFIEDKLGGKLNKLLGVPETPEAPPVEGEVAPQKQPNIKEEAAKEAVKALQGLFGR